MLGAILSAQRSKATPPQVVIVGAGFGGLWAAKTLANAPIEVVVIDRSSSTARTITFCPNFILGELVELWQGDRFIVRLSPKPTTE